MLPQRKNFLVSCAILKNSHDINKFLSFIFINLVSTKLDSYTGLRSILTLFHETHFLLYLAVADRSVLIYSG